MRHRRQGHRFTWGPCGRCAQRLRATGQCELVQHLRGNKPFVEAHPKVAEGFVKAMAGRVDYMKTHPTQALSIMAKTSGISHSTAKTELAGYHIYSLADQTTSAVLGQGGEVAGAGTTLSMTNNWKVLYQAGFLSNPPPSDMAAYVDPSFAKAAQRSS